MLALFISMSAMLHDRQFELNTPILNECKVVAEKIMLKGRNRRSMPNEEKSTLKSLYTSGQVSLYSYTTVQCLGGGFSARRLV